jgi:hypothetical protein
MHPDSVFTRIANQRLRNLAVSPISKRVYGRQFVLVLSPPNSTTC